MLLQLDETHIQHLTLPVIQESATASTIRSGHRSQSHPLTATCQACLLQAQHDGMRSLLQRSIKNTRI